jgi:moderate conductance mechanosensitive channel
MAAPQWRARGVQAGILPIALLVATLAAPAVAQSPASRENPPRQVRELLQLLDGPAVRDWLEAQRTATSPAAPAAQSEKAKIEGYFGGRIATIRQHFASLAATFPRLPADFEQARGLLVADLHERGLIEILLLLGGFVALGFGAALPKPCRWQ